MWIRSCAAGCKKLLIVKRLSVHIEISNKYQLNMKTDHTDLFRKYSSQKSLITNTNSLQRQVKKNIKRIIIYFHINILQHIRYYVAHVLRIKNFDTRTKS